MDLFERVKERHDLRIGDKLTHINLDLKNIVQDIERLQEHIVILMSENTHIRDMLDDLCETDRYKIRLPHKCPICDGTTTEKNGELCIPCDGKGIVWG